ncbi:ABC transporter permease [bacterium]|nr:ABC transporter permease [bacterium]NBX49760.1 ABC transporter permease [bacterium]
MNSSHVWIPLYTIVRKEVIRIFRIWKQTLLPPVITQTLYFLVFGAFIGSRISDIDGLPYIAFIVPGLIMMVVIQNAFANTVSSFFGAKFMHNIDEILVSPTPNSVMLSGYVLGGVLRGVITGFLVFLISLFFAHPTVEHVWAIIVFTFLTSLIFSLLGFTNSLFAKSFDDVGIFTTFLIVPLTYLGGVFYTIEHLPEPWKTISLFNPIVYMVDGLRYGFFGASSTNPWLSAVALTVLCIVLFGFNMHLLKKGSGLRN